MVSNLCSRPLGELTQVGQTRTCQQNTLYKLIAKYVLVNVGSSHPESRGQLIPQDEILYPIMGSLPHPPPLPHISFPKISWHFLDSSLLSIYTPESEASRDCWNYPSPVRQQKSKLLQNWIQEWATLHQRQLWIHLKNGGAEGSGEWMQNGSIAM